MRTKAVVSPSGVLPTQRREDTTIQDGKSSLDRPLQITVVQISSPAFCLCWWVGLLIHTATAVFVLCAAFVHLALSLPAIHANTPALHLTVPLKRIGGISYLLVALLHLHSVVQMINMSLCARRLTMSTPDQGRLIGSTRFGRLASQWRGMRVLWQLYRRVWHCVQAVFGRDGYLGINGRYFNLSMMVRELTEVSLQSYQLWALSRSVSRSGLNTFAVLTVIFNCWSIPLVHVVFRKRERVRRLMLLVVDMVLDWTCAVLIPVCVLLPYFLVFDFEKREVPVHLNGDDVWFANAVADGRQTLVTSYLDLFASLLPQYSIYSCLRLLKRLLVRADGGRNRARAIVPTSLRLASSKTDRTDSNRRRIHREAHAMRLVSMVLGVWGAIVLGFHIHATSFASLANIPGCLLYLRPWFASRPSCSVLYINCHRLNMNGYVHETTQLMDQLEQTMVTRVIFAHCPTLTVPPIVTEFPSLTGLLVHNSTIVEWSQHAAIRESTHPMFIATLIGSSNVSEFPQGLLHDELPIGMATMLFHNCTLSVLPENIGDLWASSTLKHLTLESLPLRSLPASLGRLPLRQLHIMNNQLTQLPESLLANMQLHVLSLSGNPLTQLPVNGGDVSALRELLVEHTNVSVLPAWVVSWLDTHRDDTQVLKSFYGSDVCDHTNFQESKVCETDRKSTRGSDRALLIQDRYPI